MATIRRSGSGWQALIRKKEYLGPKAKDFDQKRRLCCGQMLLKDLLKDQKVK